MSRQYGFHLGFPLGYDGPKDYAHSSTGYYGFGQSDTLMMKCDVPIMECENPECKHQFYATEENYHTCPKCAKYASAITHQPNIKGPMTDLP